MDIILRFVFSKNNTVIERSRNSTKGIDTFTFSLRDVYNRTISPVDYSAVAMVVKPNGDGETIRVLSVKMNFSVSVNYDIIGVYHVSIYLTDSNHAIYTVFDEDVEYNGSSDWHYIVYGEGSQAPQCQNTICGGEFYLEYQVDHINEL